MEKNYTSGIHCKVAYKDQFRRFLFNGTEFSSLYAQVKQVLGLDKEFVLKYKDNEGDLITISSSEELACASFEGNILRFTAHTIEEQTNPDSCAPHFPTESPGHCPRFHGGRGRRGGRGHHRGGWAHHHEGHVPFPPAGFRMKLLMKQERIQAKLAQLSEIKELSAEQQRKQTYLQEKLKHIDAKIAKFSEGGDKDCWKSKGEKHWKKYEKHGYKNWKKHDKHWKNHEKMCVDKEGTVLSEEDQIEIAKLKSQIEVLTPPWKEVKNQIKEKKMAMQNFTTESELEKLLKEIADLKVVKKDCECQIKPLKKKIKELKKSN